MNDKHLNNLLILNTSKDILDNINMSAMVKNWVTLKERRIIVYILLEVGILNIGTYIYFFFMS